MELNQSQKVQVEDKGQQEYQALRVLHDAKRSEGMEVYEYQVSGKTPKYIDKVNGVIYKMFSKKEYQFYQFVKAIKEENGRAQFKPFLVEYLGVFKENQLEGMSDLKKEGTNQSNNVEQMDDKQKTARNLWINHISMRSKEQAQQLTFIGLRNLTHNYQNPNILDLKLGRKKQKKSNVKFQTSTTNSHHFRINGMVVHLRDGQKYEQCFMSKYFGQKITVNEIERYLSLFFFNGQRIDLKLVERVSLQLQKLIAGFKKFRGVRLISSSLFIAHDAGDAERWNLKLIDFDKYEHDESIQEDTNISKGLQNVLYYLRQLKKNIKQHQTALIGRKLAIFNEQVMIVPQEKIAKYKMKQAQEEENNA